MVPYLGCICLDKLAPMLGAFLVCLFLSFLMSSSTSFNGDNPSRSFGMVLLIVSVAFYISTDIGCLFAVFIIINSINEYIEI